MRGKSGPFSRDTDNVTPSWVNDYAEMLEKNSVQSVEKDRSMYDQISNIMNGNSRFATVDEAVSDMKERTGLSVYLNQIAAAENQIKTAQSPARPPIAQTADAADTNVAIEVELGGTLIPEIVSKINGLDEFLRKFIEARYGNTSVSSVTSELVKLFSNNGFTPNDEDNADLKHYINELIIEEKKNHLARNNVNPNMGRIEYTSETNNRGNDFFEILMPAK